MLGSNVEAIKIRESEISRNKIQDEAIIELSVK